LTERFPDAESVELDNAIYVGDQRWMEFFTIAGLPDGASVADGFSNADGFQLLRCVSPTEESNTSYVLVLVDEEDPFILQTITRTEAVPHRVFVTDGRLTAVVSVTDWDHLKQLAEVTESKYAAFELLSTAQADDIASPLGIQAFKRTVQGKLTDRQLNVLETAYGMGYFDVPQGASGEDVAGELGISQGTLSELLRDAQTTLFGVLFGQRDG
jgi:hypothetical protein